MTHRPPATHRLPVPPIDRRTTMTTAPVLRRATAPALGAALLLGLTACGGGDPLAEEDGSATASSETVTVGSADFPESQIVAELYAGALESAGVETETSMGIGA